MHPRRALFAIWLAACTRSSEPAVDPIRVPDERHVVSREHRRSLAPEPASIQPIELGVAPLLVDTTAGPLMTPGGRWSPGTGSDVLFTQGFMQIDEQALWIQPEIGAALLRVPRDRDARWVRGGFECPGWLLGERDDLLWCAEDREQYVDIRVIDKSGFGAPSLVATFPELYPSSLHPSLDHQGPVIVGERVVMAASSGFVSAELEGDGALEFIELGHRPSCVVVRGERLAWRVARGSELYSGELPLSTIRREYVDDNLLGCPAWAGDSLLITRLEHETMKLLRLTEDGALLAVVELPRAGNNLVSDAEHAWWLVRGHGLWWIDAASHGKVNSVEFFPHTMTADQGLLSWMTDRQGGRAMYLSDTTRGSIVWL
jgi:hypothetical protein